MGFLMLTICLAGVQAQESSMPLGELHNCETLKMPEFDEAMTRQERVEILDALLTDMLHREGGCEIMAASPASASSAGGGGGLRGAQQSDALSTGGVGGESEPPLESPTELESEQVAIDPELAEDSSLSEARSGFQQSPTLSSKTPEDIPPADNDSVIERQLREAAMAESDPVKQAKLWNKYREYKNLPEKPVPHAL